MNSKIALTIEIILLIAYLTTILFILDTSKTTGLIELGILTAIIFTVIIVLEKKREKMIKEAEGTQPVTSETATSIQSTAIPPTSSNKMASMNQQQGASTQSQNPSLNQSSSFQPRQPPQ